MAQTIDAVFEKGVFRPKKPVKLREGQDVKVEVVPQALTKEEAKALLREWQELFEGLSDEEVAEITDFRRRREQFLTPRDEAE